MRRLGLTRLLGFAAGVVVLVTLGWLGGLTARQLMAVGIFASLIFATLFFWTYRLAFAFLALCLLMAAGLLDVPHFIEFAKIDVVMFLVAMMTVVGYLEERRFFEHVIEEIFRRVQPNAWQFCVLIMVLAALSAALVDEVTSILFMTAITLHFVTRLGVKSAPFVMMLIFATNIGSAATVVGNPVGVMVALQGGLTFIDFLRWASPVALASLVLTIPLCLWYFRRPVRELQLALVNHAGRAAPAGAPEERDTNLRNSALIFLSLILALILHSPIESWLGLEKNTMLLGAALGFAGLVLVLDRIHAREIIERRVDWWTLSFFLALFASVGTLRLVGVTSELARLKSYLAGESEFGLVVVVLWVGGVLSALMDNVLAVATLIPIVQDLQAQGVFALPLWWGLLFGGTLFGNVTMIGSTANIIAIGVLERRKLGVIDFWTWLKPGALVGVATLALATLWLWWQMAAMRSLP
jgi:Na+/H+ antiporter NhaD/arsenite permease-like protein